MTTAIQTECPRCHLMVRQNKDGSLRRHIGRNSASFCTGVAKAAGK